MAQAVPGLARPLTTSPSDGRRSARGHCPLSGRESALEAFLVSTGVVALAEMGDKTQLLAFILAARFRKPVPIIAGILLATLANHTIAGALGRSEEHTSELQSP